jgi:hypothetical protein
MPGVESQETSDRKRAIVHLNQNRSAPKKNTKASNRTGIPRQEYGAQPNSVRQARLECVLFDLATGYDYRRGFRKLFPCSRQIPNRLGDNDAGIR